MQDGGMKPMKEKDARKIFAQLAQAIKYIHNNKVIHMDIKLDNIMYDNTTGRATLIDFGLCDFITEENGDMITRRVGSQEYSAPELLEKSEKPFSGKKADVWCLGMVLYALLSCNFPFSPKKRKEMIRNGCHPELKFKFKLSDKGKDLIKKMLTVNPEERFTIEQVLAHPWMTK